MSRALAASLLFAAAPALAQSVVATPAPRAVDQGAVIPTGSAATAGGPDALLLNPAGLTFFSGQELDYLHQRSVLTDRVIDSAFYGASLASAFAAGAGYEWVRPGPGSGASFRRLTLGLSVGDPSLSLGAAYHAFYSSASFTLDRLSSWDVGLVARPLRAVSLGLSILDLDAPRLGPVELPRRYDVGLGIRPFAERLTLSTDFLIDSREGLPAASLSYNAQWRIVDGVALLAGVSHFFNRGTFVATLGLALDAAQLGMAYAADTDDGRTGVDHTLAVRFSTARHPEIRLGPARFATIDLSEALASPAASPVSLVLGSHGPDPFLTLLAELRRAKDDPAIQGLVIELSGAEDGAGPGKIEELRQAIAALRAAGKPSIAFMSNADDLDYYLASACDRIYAVPEAMLLINGLSSDTLFLGDLLTKIGVHVDVARVGAYKNAPDQLTRADMSPEQREAIAALQSTIFRRYLDAVNAGRKISPATFKQVLDRGILTPKEALGLGLIDGVKYPDELNALAAALAGRQATLVGDYGSWDEQSGRWGAPPEIAVVRVQGLIAEGKSSSAPLGVGAVAGADTLVEGIEAARDDEQVKAIVVRIDSGGGSGNASDLIYRALAKAREKKPVVVSMGDVAASGGYYVALGGDVIWAEHATVTGSIGVFALHPDFSGLFGKVGVRSVTVKQGARADILDANHPWSEAEQKTMQAWTDAFYDDFISLVAARRQLQKSAVDKVARGRVWSGDDARQRGLVDALGSLDDAIADAKRRAGIAPGQKVALETFGEPKGIPLLGGLEDASIDARLRSSLEQLGLARPAGEAVHALAIARQPGALAVMPFELQWR